MVNLIKVFLFCICRIVMDYEILQKKRFMTLSIRIETANLEWQFSV